MSGGEHAPGTCGRGLWWFVTVIDKRGNIVKTGIGADEKEVQAFCTIARSEDLNTRIYINPPAGNGRWWD